MAQQVTDFGAAQWLGMLFGINSIPSHYYIALAAAQPTQGITGTVLAALEPTARFGSTSYARQSIAADGSHFGLTTSGFVTNINPVVFGIPDVDWGYMPYFAICDAVTAGNVYAYGQFSNPQHLTTLTQVTMPAGAIVMRAISVLPSIVT